MPEPLGTSFSDRYLIALQEKRPSALRPDAGRQDVEHLSEIEKCAQRHDEDAGRAELDVADEDDRPRDRDEPTDRDVGVGPAGSLVAPHLDHRADDGHG